MRVCMTTTEHMGATVILYEYVHARTNICLVDASNYSCMQIKIKILLQTVGSDAFPRNCDILCVRTRNSRLIRRANIVDIVSCEQEELQLEQQVHGQAEALRVYASVLSYLAQSLPFPCKCVTIKIITRKALVSTLTAVISWRVQGEGP